MKYKLSTVAIVVMIFVSSCYYDNAEELYPSEPCNTANVTYSGDIQPLVDSRCNSCHSAATKSGGVDLEGYTALKVYVDNGKFLSSVTHDGNASTMPPGDKLIDCSINKIQQWINDGAPNN